MTGVLCTRCLGQGWICEHHPDRPWPHVGCQGAGDPCPHCNAGPIVEDPPGFSAHERPR